MSPGEILTPSTEREVLQHTEILVLRQISDGLAVTNRHLENLTGEVRDVRDKVIGLEAAKIDERLSDLLEQHKQLMARVDQLESDRDKRAGIAAVFGWMSKHMPWLLTALGVGTAAGWGAHKITS